MEQHTEYSLLHSLVQVYAHWTGLGIVVAMAFVLVACRSSSARDILDAEVEALPVPPGSVILARNDRLGGGQIPECAGVVTELLLGNDAPAEDIYEFYTKELPSQGWNIDFQGTYSIGLSKGKRFRMEVSDSYYFSSVAPHNQIQIWEQQFRSLTYIGIGYSFYDPAECEEALDRRLGK